MPVALCLCCSGVVDAVLIPEVNFTLTGDKGLFKYLEGVIANKGHCVVCVAEGAGQVTGLNIPALRDAHCVICTMTYHLALDLPQQHMF